MKKLALLLLISIPAWATAYTATGNVTIPAGYTATVGTCPTTYPPVTPDVFMHRWPDTGGSAGNWNSNTTWGGSGQPGSGDTATIQGDLIIPAGGTLLLRGDMAFDGAGIAMTSTVGTGYADTSTTSLTVGTGTQTLTVSSGKSFTTGQYVQLINQTPTNSYTGNMMIGTVTSYSGTTLAVSIVQVYGSGSLSQWYVTVPPLVPYLCNQSGVSYGMYPSGSSFDLTTFTWGGSGDSFASTVVAPIANTGAESFQFWGNPSSKHNTTTFHVYGTMLETCGNAALVCMDISISNQGSIANTTFVANNVGINHGGALGSSAGNSDSYNLTYSLTNFRTTNTQASYSYAGNFGGTLPKTLTNIYVDNGNQNPASGCDCEAFTGVSVTNAIYNGTSVTGPYSLWTSFSNVLLRQPDCSNQYELQGPPTGPLYDYCDTSSGAYNPHQLGPYTNGVSGAFGYIVFDYADAGTEGNCMVPNSSGTLTASYNIVLLNSNGYGACTLAYNFNGSGQSPWQLNHNTVLGPNSYGSVWYNGENGPTTEQTLLQYTNNLYTGSGTSDFAVACNAGASGCAGMLVNSIAPASVTNNVNWNVGAAPQQGVPSGTANGTPYNQYTSGTVPGANDQNVNPRVVNPNVNLRNWAVRQGQSATANAAFGIFASENPSYYPATLNNLFSYVYAGVTPTNPALWRAASDGTDIGAVNTPMNQHIPPPPSFAF